jgi:RimJ/RimL family protein N-acetyltransferase
MRDGAEAGSRRNGMRDGPLPEDERRKEIGYAIGRKHWGHGYATETARSFLEWIRAGSRRGAVYATVDVGASASVRVLEKIGKSPCTGEDVQPFAGHAINFARLSSPGD